MKEQFGVAVGIFQSQVQSLKETNPGINLSMDPKVLQFLHENKINVYKTSGDIVHLERFSEKTVEVPVQDSRTKHLIHLFATEMKRLTGKYPKLL